MFRRISVAFDESPEAGRALQAAVELAKSLHPSLTVVSVIEPAPIFFSTLAAPYIRWTDEMRTRYITLQAKARKFAEDAGLAIEADLSTGDEVESILKAARHHQSDLLVIGMPKHNWIIATLRKTLQSTSLVLYWESGSCRLGQSDT
jgi:nucleotide-binding universal stress UspA family protein